MAKITNYKQLAGAAADEIMRRGWGRDHLALNKHGEGIDYIDHEDVAVVADCKVCAVGGMNAAITGNPLSPNLTPEEYVGRYVDDGYDLFRENEGHPLHEEACKISQIFNTEGLKKDFDHPNACSESPIITFNDGVKRRTRVVNLLRKIESGEFDSRFK